MLIKDIYTNFKKEAERPLRLRGRTVIGRDGDVIPRRHHLNYKALYAHSEALKSGILCIPYRKGVRSALVAALFDLGPNISHPIQKAITLFKEVASDNSFRNIKGQTALQVLFLRSGKMDYEALKEKIMAETCELQRLTGMHPYGLKLAQIGFFINIYKHDNGNVFIKLNGGVKGDIEVINQVKKSYKKNGKPIMPDITDYDIKMVTKWTIEKAEKMYPIEEEF
tara:strand:- start:2449 stop:3120 length:672 start_codon:yes stop_codon:yes gene_type:complete